MEWIDLGNPRPKQNPTKHESFVWPTGTIHALSPLTSHVEKSFFEVISHRRSSREFNKLNMDSLGELLFYTCRVQETGSAELGFSITRRPAPSAGAIHPIHVLILPPVTDVLYRYDPFQHELSTVPVNLNVEEIRGDIEHICVAPSATLLLFAAEYGMTAAKYLSPSSLVWRDAGALLGHMSLIAEALDLNYCALGITGEPWISSLFKQSGLVGVGTALVGSKLSP